MLGNESLWEIAMRCQHIDGSQATSELKNDPELGSISIIAVTGYSLSGDKARAKSAGCDSIHVKPPDIDELVMEIETLVAACGNQKQ